MTINSDSRQLYLHVGLRKTATTWMQNHLFPKIQGLNFLGKTDVDYPDWLIQWSYWDDSYFQSNVKMISKRIGAMLVDDKKTLISSEAFTNTAVILNQAERIKSVWSNSKIIVTIRDPIDTIISHYHHDIKEGTAFRELQDYVDIERTPFFIGKRKRIYLPDYYYTEMIENYNRLFGEENVCVLKYEDLTMNPQQFVSELSEFMGLMINEEEVQFNVRLNPGESPKHLGKARYENLLSSIIDIVPDIHQRIPYEAVGQYFEGDGVDPIMKDQLIEILRGKAHPYY